MAIHLFLNYRSYYSARTLQIPLLEELLILQIAHNLVQ